MITTLVINDAARFEELRDEWNGLLRASSCNCLFLTWEWLYTWWSHLSENRRLHIITVRRDGLLIAIAPLALRPASFKRLMPMRTLEFIASGSVGSDYLSFLIRIGYETDALREIAASLAQSRLMLELVRIDKTSSPMVNLALQLRESGWESTFLTTNYAPYISLTGLTWESYCRGLHSVHRDSLSRRLKKLYKDFDVKFEVAESEPERRVALDSFVRLHLARWSGSGGSTALHRQELINFHEAISKLSLDLGWLRLYTLVLEGVPAASLYAFKYDQVHYYYQIAHELQFSKYGVGVVILALAIKAAIEGQAREFDFLHDDEEYKYLWAREERELIRLELYPSRNAGKVCQRSRLIKRWIRHQIVHMAEKRLPRQKLQGA